MSVSKRTWRTKSGEIKHSWMIYIASKYFLGENQKPIRETSPVQTRRGAEAYERQRRAELLAAKEKGKEKPPPPRLVEFVDEFLQESRANNKESTQDEKRHIMRHHLQPRFGQFRLDAIQQREIERFKAGQLDAGYSRKTVNNHLTVLSRCLNLAYEYGLIDRVPKIKRLKVPEPEFDYLEFEEADRLIEGASDDPHWQRFITVALHTGLRRGELLALRWNDVDLHARTIRVARSWSRGREGTPKGHVSRIVPLNRRALSALKAHRHLRGPVVFCRDDGSHWKEDQVRPAIRRACRKAGLRVVGTQVLRHTFASHLAMRGATMKAIQELLGHTDIRVTMRYAHLSPSQRIHAVELLEGSNDTYTAHAER